MPKVVHVFGSGDRRTFGLTFDGSASNLPSVPGGWQNYDEIPVCLRYLSRYGGDPETARANLLERGYHLARTIGRIMPLPESCSISRAGDLVRGAKENV